MQSLKTQAHSFIIRVWYEPTSATGPLGEWRGSLINVMSCDQRYYSDVPKLGRAVLEALQEIESSLSPGDEEITEDRIQVDRCGTADDDGTRKEPGM